MDNDNFLKKHLAILYRNAKLKMIYPNLCTETQGNHLIAEKLTKNQPFAIVRLGAVEMHCVNRFLKQQNFSETEKEQAFYCAGIFPNDNTTLNKFCEVYLHSVTECDMIGVWGISGEKHIIQTYADNPKIIPSKSLEPYYFENAWSKHLKDKKILVVHPFTESIRYQLKNRHQIWQNKDILPEPAKTEFVKAVQSNAGAKPKFSDWFEALQSMKEQIAKKDFDVALIGAGAYGLPLSVFCKQLGKQAVQLCGATQILFGIKGKRWDNHPVISQFYNPYWTRPLPSETPPEIQKVEGGSYW